MQLGMSPEFLETFAKSMAIVFGAERALDILGPGMALPLAFGLLGRLLGRDRPPVEDQEWVTAHRIVQRTLSDADACGVAQVVHHTDWRAGVTVEEMEALEEEARLREQENRN